MQDLVEERGQLLLVKGREAAQQDVEDDAHRPEVDLVRVRVRVRVGVRVGVGVRVRVRVRKADLDLADPHAGRFVDGVMVEPLLEEVVHDHI